MISTRSTPSPGIAGRPVRSRSPCYISSSDEMRIGNPPPIPERRIAAMDSQAFKRSISAAAPPAGLSLALQALWWAEKGDWQKAHECAQAQEDAAGAWVHAHLHREEGDLANAGYWYRRAGKPVASEAPAVERDAIARALL